MSVILDGQWSMEFCTNTTRWILPSIPMGRIFYLYQSSFIFRFSRKKIILTLFIHVFIRIYFVFKRHNRMNSALRCAFRMHAFYFIWAMKFPTIIYPLLVQYHVILQLPNIWYRKGEQHCSVDLNMIIWMNWKIRISPRDFNSFGSRRGNDHVMVRGTFNHPRLNNKLVTAKTIPLFPSSSPAPTTTTLHLPSKLELDVFDASELYRNTKTPLIILAGKDYGCGPSRDWIAKGPWMLVSIYISMNEIFSDSSKCLFFRVFELFWPRVSKRNIDQI